MGNFTIGVFDSGMGGLTAIRSLRQLLPHNDIVYFGDTGHMPYGGRSREQLLYMARKNVTFLESLGSKLVLAACGTVTSVALGTVCKETDTPLFGVAIPAAEKAKEITKNKVIGFIATQACVDSGYNQELLERMVPGATVIARACPKFVPLIESGIFSPDNSELMAAIEEYLADIKLAGADCLILGCTHYPLIAEAIGKYLGTKTQLISSSGQAALALAETLKATAPPPDTSHRGNTTYYTSGDAEVFSTTAEQLLGHALLGDVIAIAPYTLI